MEEITHAIVYYGINMSFEAIVCVAKIVILVRVYPLIYCDKNI